MRKKMVGLAICGYNENKNQFEIAWIDNQHLGSEIMFLTGNNISNTFSALGHYNSADKSQIWSWRTIFELKNPNNLVIQHFNITPEGLEYIGVEIDYKRV